MRAFSQASLDAMSSGAWAGALMVEAEFTSGTLRLCTARSNIEDTDSPPNIYYASGLLGAVEEVTDAVRDVNSLNMTVGGVDPAIIAIALGEQVRGRPLRLYFALLDPGTHALLDMVQIWSGSISAMNISQQNNLATIKLTAEHRGALFSRAKPIRYTDADQQRLYPGDRCLEYIVSQSQQSDVWPAAGFFKK